MIAWTPLPTGRFTHIDWARRGAIDGLDPYLAWLEAFELAHAKALPNYLPLAIELKPGVTIAQFARAGAAASLRVPKAYLAPQAPAGLRFCTAKVGPAFFRAVQPGQPLHELLQRYELGLPAGSSLRSDALDRDVPLALPTGRRRAKPRLLSGDVVAIIDDSLAVANASFLQAGRARTRHFWRQDGRGMGRVPAGFGYGHELNAADIDAALRRHTYRGQVDEAAVYVELGLSCLGRRPRNGRLGFHALDVAASHGTHVMDLAAGPVPLRARIGGGPPDWDAPPAWQAAGDTASRAELIAVQLDHRTVADTSGGSLNVHVLDGLMYVLSRCGPDARVVVNVSFGTIAGPHDGTSVLEAAIDQLVGLTEGRLQVAIAAGNSYQQRTHANLRLRKGSPQTLHWHVQPDDRTQSFVEIWIEEGCAGVEIEITPPGGKPLPFVRIGESGLWTGGGASPLCGLIYPHHAATGRLGTCALVALAPTTCWAPDGAVAPSGSWRIRLRNGDARPAVVDAYVERDDLVMGAGTGARQSWFEDKDYDTSGNPGSFVDRPGSPTPIRRSGSFNSIGTCSSAVAVGGVRFTHVNDPQVLADGLWAHYSPRMPDPDPGRPQRPRVKTEPDAQAVSDENPALEGVNAAGSRSGSLVRLRGTSAAAPQYARALLNAAKPRS